MTAPGTDDLPSTVDREFVHARMIQAPRHQVFRAFSDPSQLARWWGPEGFSNTFEIFEFTPGGRWRFVMHGPDGTDYPNDSVFLAIEPPERIVIEHLSEEHHFLLYVRFDEHGDQTGVRWRQVFDTVAHRDRIAPVVETANEQNLDRLSAEVLATMQMRGGGRQ